MAEKSKASKAKSSTKRKMKYMTFSAMPAEIESYKRAAAMLDRSASWWIREVLNKAAAIEIAKGKPDADKNKAVSVAPIPSHGASDHLEG